MLNKDIILAQESKEIKEIELDDRLYKLSEYLSMGIPIKDLAERLSRSEAWVRKYRKDPRVVSFVKELQAEALQSAKLCIQNTTIKAALKIEALIDDPDPKIALAASTNTLDRVGLKAAEKKEETININYAHMTNEEIRESIESRLRALRGEGY